MSPTYPEPDRLLTLVLPRSLEEEVLDTLHAHPALAQGFTVQHGAGMGTHVELASALEQVRGRAHRVIVQVALHESQVTSLLQALQADLPHPRITYWVLPLLAFGRFSDAQP